MIEKTRSKNTRFENTSSKIQHRILQDWKYRIQYFQLNNTRFQNKLLKIQDPKYNI
jgi:hypothetical protein